MNNNDKKIILMIPAHNPDDKLIKLLDDLKTIWSDPIVIVNDGSDPEIAKTIFPQAVERGAIVIHHATNLGKGRALKTGFNEILNRFPDCIGCVTADADGQHLPKDIVATAQMLSENPTALVLGCRDFDKANVPARSQFGNKTTRNFMRLLCNVSVTDTQTGLRGISAYFMKVLLRVSGERFDFETNMLLETNNYDIPIREVTIDTVYIEQNRASHFNPIKDSINIYAQLFKYCGSSLIGFLIDIGFFTLFSALLANVVINGLTPETTTTVCVYIATALARIISATANYLMNQKVVFKTRKKANKSAAKYACLAIVQMLASASLVALLVFLVPFIPKTVWKLLVDSILFFLSFKIQKKWVFNN